MPLRKWPNDSLKTQASTIRRKARKNGDPIPSYEDIIAIFVDQGKITSTTNTHNKTPVMRPWPKNQKTPPPEEQIAPQIALTPYIAEIKDIQAHFIHDDLPCGVKDAMLLKEKSDTIGSCKAVPPWHDPPLVTQAEMDDPALITSFKASPKQIEIKNAVAYGPEKIIMIEGTKRTGKSTFCWYGINEAIWNGTHKRWRMYGASQDNAMDIHEGVKNDPLTIPFLNHLLKGTGSRMRSGFFNDGFVQVMSTGAGKGGERRSSGTDCDAVWIDESHSVLIKAPRTVAMAAMILLAQPNIRIVFSMNREGQAYEMFKNMMLDKIDKKDIRFITITQDDVFHISDESSAIVRTLVEASAGADMARQYMDNEYIQEDDLIYELQSIKEAFERCQVPKLEQFDKIGCGVDWGSTHDTAFHVMGFLGAEGFELETIYLKKPTNTILVHKFDVLIQKYPGIVFVWETSPIGSFVRTEVELIYPTVEFIDSNFTQHKADYITNLYMWLVDRSLHLHDGKLLRQLSSFKNDKKNDDGHDALAHVLYMLQTPRTAEKIELGWL